MTEEARRLMNAEHAAAQKKYWQRKAEREGKTVAQVVREAKEARWERKAGKLKQEMRELHNLHSLGDKQGVISISLDADVLREDGLEIYLSRNGMNDAQYIDALVKSNKVLKSENRRLQRLLTRYQKIISIGVNQFIRDYENW